MVGKRVAHYRILKQLGVGGMGEVFLAEDTELRRNVALKFLPENSASNPESLERFKKEARTSAALNHPNITTIYEVGMSENRPYIAMAFEDGQTLSDIIESGQKSFREKVEIAIQICRGLSRAHEAGIVHRDIKPDNIVINRDGRVKILDFGIAKLKGDRSIPSEISTLGTAYYMSPEQIRGGEVDSRSDIFAFGVVLFEMLMGTRPFKGGHVSAVFYSITTEAPAPVENIGLTQEDRSELGRLFENALHKDPEQRYQGVDEIQADLRKLISQKGRESSGDLRHRLIVWVPVALAAVVVSLLVLNPFRIEFRRNAKANAANNTVAVMYFENLVEPGDSDKLGEIVKNLMITDLSDADLLQVVSSQRLYDLLKLMAKEVSGVIDKSTSTEIATRAGARWMLQGSILQVEPAYVLTSQLIDVSSGNVVASQRIDGVPGESIFQMVDRLSDEARSDLSIPPAGSGGIETDVADVTTHSEEAYRIYLTGIEKQNSLFMKDARQCFQKAVELDSTFAMAYLHLSDRLVAGTYAEKKEAIDRAVKFSDRASRKEVLYIDAAAALFYGDGTSAIHLYEDIIDLYPDEKHAYIRLGELYRDVQRDLVQARAAFEKVVAMDPLEKNVYNQLAYLYNFIGDFERSIWAINQYINLAVDEPNPYDSRADIYAYNGRLDEAIQSYNLALGKKQDFYMSALKLGHMAVFRDDLDEARRFYTGLVDVADEDNIRRARMFVAYLPLYRGDFKKTLRSLDDEIERDRKDGYLGNAYIAKLFNRALIYANLRDHERTTAAAEEYRREYTRLRAAGDELWRLNYGFINYVCGRSDEAENMLGAFLASIDSLSEIKMMGYAALKGLVEMDHGNTDAACSYLERANRNIKVFGRQFWLGRTYLAANRPTEAKAVFDDMLDRYTEFRAGTPILSIQAWYYAGLASERSGDITGAKQRYNRFLSYWGDADPLPQEVLNARSRLVQLQRDI